MTSLKHGSEGKVYMLVIPCVDIPHTLNHVITVHCDMQLILFNMYACILLAAVFLVVSLKCNQGTVPTPLPHPLIMIGLLKTLPVSITIISSRCDIEIILAIGARKQLKT
mmetsp:Transcript_23764/g.38546  ORF Transcript_23764/g.38546 Transcript_23764/m.38546 type:complete len:110 (+) Transcript_23764:144-473(+)